VTTRYQHSGNAVPAVLSGGITAASTTINISDSSGWPDGSIGKFWVTIARGTDAEEKVRVLSRTGTSLTLSGVGERGLDGTTASSHDAGVSVEHTISATEIDEYNSQLAALTALGGTPLTTSASQSVTNKTLALGSNTVTGTKAQFNSAMTDADFATLAGTETLTNKTLALGSNSVSGTLAQLNSAVTDADLASLAGSESLSNKTLASPVLTGTMTGAGSINVGGDIQADGTISAVDSGGFEIIMGYASSRGLSIANAGPAVATHPNGMVLWTNGTNLFCRKPGGGDVSIA
jgi:hypothetical protein